MKTHLHPNNQPSPHRSRAAAEIELLVIIPILLTLLFIAVGLLALGPARVTNGLDANELALHDATATATPAFANTSTMDPLPYPAEVPDGFPNSVHEAIAEKQLKAATPFPALTLQDKALYISPSLTYSAYPVANDQQNVLNWFNAYAEENRTPELVQALDLSQTGP